MKIRMMLMMFCVLAFTSAVFAQSNGSFENGINPGSFTTVSAGSNNITDWSVNFGSVDYIGSYWQASEGVRSIDLNGTTRGQISQRLTTVPGSTYQVTFDMSGNPDGSPAQKIMSVSINGGQSSQSYTYDTSLTGNTREDMKWMSNTYFFTATSRRTVLAFTSEIVGLFGPALDNVTITLINSPNP